MQLLWHQLRVSVLVLKERLLRGLQDPNGNFTGRTDILQAFSRDPDPDPDPDPDRQQVRPTASFLLFAAKSPDPCSSEPPRRFDPEVAC